MKDFIFHPDLRNELSWLMDNPLKAPSPLCFYGVPAQGKTTFAKHLADIMAKEIVYYDANSFRGNDNSSSAILKDIHDRTRVMAPFFLEGREDKPWDWCFIIDEWHNFSNVRQDSFKVPFEELSKNNRCLFIICCNTDNKKDIRDTITPAIYSRCHSIRFDILADQKNEVEKLAKKAFPMLNEWEIRSSLPDWRKLKRKAEMLR